MHGSKASLVCATYCLVSVVSAGHADAGQFKKLFDFHWKQGIFPASAVVDVGGTLYGETAGDQDGNLFSINLASGAFTEMHRFHGGKFDGMTPAGSLTYVDGTLYGVTYRGGPLDEGTIYTLDPVSGAYDIVYKFKDATLRGENPSAGLLAWRNKLYGTEAGGGAYGDGAIFEFDPLKRSVRVVYSFPGGTNGGGPAAQLVELNGVLYGALRSGGNGGNCMGGFACGTVFAVDPKGRTGEVLYSFAGGNDGFYPNSDLIKMNGLLYGTTFYGGSSDCGGYGCGTVYSIDPSTGVEKVLANFTGPNSGGKPAAGLVQHGETFYGTATFGSSSPYGAIFKFDPRSGAEKEIFQFKDGRQGDYPVAPLISVDGTFYGTTNGGGALHCSFSGCGTVFSFNR